MKRLLFIAFAALALVACNKQKDFTLTGVVDSRFELNGKGVTLSFFDGTAERTLTTTINDNAFQLSCNVPEEQLANLKIDGFIDKFVLCLEKGEVEMQIVSLEADSDDDAKYIELGKIYIKGTPQNDIINDYLTMESNLDQAVEMAASEEEADELYELFIEDNYKKAMKNIQMLGNQYVLHQIFFELTLEQRLAAFDQMSDEQRNSDDWKRYYEYSVAAKQTSVQNEYKDFAFLTLAGDSIKLSDFVGKTPYVLVDFWATWCPPCRRLLPELKNVYLANKGKLEIVGVSVDKQQSDWEKFLSENDYPWQHGNNITDASALYGVLTIPTTILIDANGQIVARNIHAKELLEFLQ